MPAIDWSKNGGIFAVIYVGKARLFTKIAVFLLSMTASAASANVFDVLSSDPNENIRLRYQRLLEAGNHPIRMELNLSSGERAYVYGNVSVQLEYGDSSPQNLCRPILTTSLVRAEGPVRFVPETSSIYFDLTVDPQAPSGRRHYGIFVLRSTTFARPRSSPVVDRDTGEPFFVADGSGNNPFVRYVRGDTRALLQRNDGSPFVRVSGQAVNAIENELAALHEACVGI